MPHGKPDWGVDWTPRTVRGLEDLGEHAVRMGSPHLWDRRGDVLTVSDFHEGLGTWIPYLSGLDAALEIWTGHSRQGAYSVRCVTGRTANFWGGIMNYLSYPVLSRWGLEFTFNLDVLTRFWYGRIRWDTTADSYDARIQVNRTTGALEYWNGAYIPFALALPMQVMNYPNHTLKFVVDPRTTPPTYVRAMLDDTIYPLTGIPVQRIGAGAMPLLWVMILHLTDIAQNVGAYLDNVIVTQNEP